jgi:probable HAF family extracellular repeat protein
MPGREFRALVNAALCVYPAWLFVGLLSTRKPAKVLSLLITGINTPAGTGCMGQPATPVLHPAGFRVDSGPANTHAGDANKAVPAVSLDSTAVGGEAYRRGCPQVVKERCIVNRLLLRGRVLTALALSALLLAPTARVTRAAPPETLYQITDLGTLGGNFSQPTAINLHGQITGFSVDAAGDYHAFLWQNGIMHDLGTLEGSTAGFSSFGLGINIEGEVVGQSDLPNSSDAFLERGGQMSDLGSLGGTGSSANAINALDDVVGYTTVATLDPTSPGGGDQEIHAFLRHGGGMSDLGTLGTGSDSNASGINTFGQVVGWSHINTGFDPEVSDPDFHAFLSQRGVMTDLGTLPGGNYSQANAINDIGQVVGFSETGTVDSADAACGNPLTFHAIQATVWQRGAVIDLAPFPGDPDSNAFGLNDLGQVVGRSGSGCASTGAALWQHGTVTDLNTVIPANSGWFLLRGRAINDFGQITGEGISPNGDTHAYLMTPMGLGLRHPVNHQGWGRGHDKNDFRHNRPIHGKPSH